MSGLKELANTAMGGALPGASAGIGGAIGNQIGYGLGQLTGYNNSLEKRQLEQQQKLTNMQSIANMGLMKESFKEQKQLWDDTNYKAQVEHLKEAGLNPALLYAKGGSGGSTGSGGTSVGGGQAATAAASQTANTQQLMAGMGLQKMSSEIDLNKATAEKLRADAKTSDETRSGIVEKLRQDGHGQWLENLKTQYTLSPEGEITYKNKETGKTASISETGLFSRQIAADIAKTVAEGKLTDEKAIGYFQELLNDTARADAAGTQAAANKLEKEFKFGELYNTKWWIQTGQMLVDDIFKGIGVSGLRKMPPKQPNVKK